MILMSVDLPAPFSPSSAWISPPWSSMETSASAWVDPNARDTWRISSTGVVGAGSPGAGAAAGGAWTVMRPRLRQR